MDAEEDLRQLFLSLAKEGKLDMADKFQTKTTLKATFCAKHGMDRESFGPAEHVYIRSSPFSNSTGEDAYHVRLYRQNFGRGVWSWRPPGDLAGSGRDDDKNHD